MRPTLSLLLIALKASSAATSAASSRLLSPPRCRRCPRRSRPPSSMTVSSRSSVYFLTKGAFIRAVTFQSIAANLVAGRVLPHLLKLHAAALEDTMVPWPLANEGVPPAAVSAIRCAGFF